MTTAKAEARAELRILLRVGLVAFLFLFALALESLPAAGTQDASGDWTVSEDTRLVRGDISREGNVTILPGVTLTLEGTRMAVGGALTILPNATLRLLPSRGVPTILTSHPDGAGFWIDMQGRMYSQGAARIDGLSGNGLVATLPGQHGGFRVSGFADLDGLTVRDSTAGIFVPAGGNATLRNALIMGLGEAGITVLGKMSLNSSLVARHEINLLGKDTCEIRVTDSRILDAAAEQILINGCRADIAGSQVEGGGVSIVANNAAYVLVRDSALIGYSVDGIESYAGARPGGGMQRPVVRFHNVSMEPMDEARLGADLSGALLAEFNNVTLHGHALHGIQAQESNLRVRDSTITGNGGMGIRLVGGRFLNDPLASDNVLGSVESPNRGGPLSYIALVDFVAVSASGAAYTQLEGNLDIEVFAQDGRLVDLLLERNESPGVVNLGFEVYQIEGDATIRFLGPFTYNVRHPALPEARTGELDLASGQVLLVVESEADAATQSMIGGLLSSILLVVGAILVIGGWWSGLGRHADRRKRRRDDEA